MVKTISITLDATHLAAAIRRGAHGVATAEAEAFAAYAMCQLNGAIKLFLDELRQSVIQSPLDVTPSIN